MGRDVESERRPGERRNEGAAVLGYGRRKDAHSVQVHDIFMREGELEAMLFSLSPSVVTFMVRTMPCSHYLRCRRNYIVHAWCCCVRCLDKDSFETCAKSVGAASRRFH
jgi:hypothetical protein